MADAVSTVTIVHERGQTPGSVAERLLRGSDEAAEGLQAVVRELEEIAGGVRGGKVSVAVDSSTAAAATLTLTADVSDATAGDTLNITVPGYPTARVTVVATGADSSAGEVAADESTDSDFGDAIAAAFNSYAPLRRHFTASNSTGTVTVTARRAGSWANSISAVEDVDSNSPFAPGASTFSGGADHGSAPSATVTCGTPDIVADDTITIGSVTLTWKASASTEDEVTLSTTPATAATNLGAKINAHSKLQGIVSASVASDVVTLTWKGAPRAGELVALSRAETNSGSVVLSGSALASSSTEAYQASSVTYTKGQA